MRGSDVLDIATMADFFGTRWQVNAVMIPVPHGRSRPYLQPVGQVMRLFGRYCGDYYAGSFSDPDADAVITVSGDRAYIHIVNLNLYRPVTVEFAGPAMIAAVHEIAPDDPMTEITPQNSGCFDEVTKTPEGLKYTLPPAGAAAIEAVIR